MPAAKALPKDVSIKLRGEYRPILSTIEKHWPISQPEILGAALMRFQKLTPEEQAEAFREVQSSRCEKQPA